MNTEISNFGLAINPETVLPYLGMPEKSLNLELRKTIEEIAAELIKVVRPRFVFKASAITQHDHYVVADDLAISFNGKSISNHLKGSKKLVVMACTLGIEPERLLQKYRLKELSKAVICDAVASALIEQLCDKVLEIILKSPDCIGLYPNGRFSPGYGDFSIQVQPQLLNALDAYRKAGIQCSDNYIMIPRKSVTAVIGLFKTKQSLKITDPCSDCQFRHNCTKKERGEKCGHS